MTPVILRTARLELSAPDADDVDAIFAACQDAGIQRYTTVPVPYHRVHAEGFIDKVRDGWDDDETTTWALRDGEGLVGMMDLHGVASRAPELGFWISPEARDRGYATEAGRAVLDWGFAGDGARAERIQWQAIVGNTESARVAMALGFRFEGTRRRALRTASGRHDAWIAALLPDDDRRRQTWPVAG